MTDFQIQQEKELESQEQIAHTNAPRTIFKILWWNVSMKLIMSLRTRDIKFCGIKLSEHLFLGVIYDAKNDEPYSCNGGVHSGEQFEDGSVAE